MSSADNIYRMLAARPRRDLLFALCETDSLRVSGVEPDRNARQPGRSAHDGTGPGALVDTSELQLYHATCRNWRRRIS
jgi:hypothetical protein